jgi:hypothetical protein
MAGFAAAFVSQPADTMLSKINKTKGLPGEGTMTRLVKIGKELGIRGSYSGIGARLFMVGTLTAGQFAIYGGMCLSSLKQNLKQILTIVQISSVSSAPLVVLRSANKRANISPIQELETEPTSLYNIHFHKHGEPKLHLRVTTTTQGGMYDLKCRKIFS